MVVSCCKACCNESARLTNHVFVVVLFIALIGAIGYFSILSMNKYGGADNAGPLWKDDHTGHISGDVILILFSLTLAGCVIYTGYSLYHDKTFWMFSAENKQMYHDLMLNSLGTAKVGVILMFLLVSVIYQSVYGNIQGATTFFGSDKYLPIILADMACGAGVGALSTSFVLFSRRKAMVSVIVKNSCIVGFILGLFNMSLESSGFNRYLATDEINEGLEDTPYSEIDGTLGLNETQLKQYAMYQAGGPPFLIAMSYSSGFLIFIFVVYHTWGMIKAAIWGAYNDPQYAVSNIPRIWCGDRCGKSAAFAFEVIFIVGLFNFIPAILSPLIRREPITSASIAVAGFIFTVGVILQIMLQYTGFLLGHTDADEEHHHHNKGASGDQESTADVVTRLGVDGLVNEYYFLKKEVERLRRPPTLTPLLFSPRNINSPATEGFELLPQSSLDLVPRGGSEY